MSSKIAALQTSPRVLSWVGAMAEALTVPMLLLQGDRLLLRANAAGLRELERADVLALHDGHVRPAQAHLAAAFDGLLAQACATHTRCTWRGRGLPEGITVAPVAAGGGQPRQWLMLVVQAEASVDDRCRLLAGQFGLTRWRSCVRSARACRRTRSPRHEA